MSWFFLEFFVIINNSRICTIYLIKGTIFDLWFLKTNTDCWTFLRFPLRFSLFSFRFFFLNWWSLCFFFTFRYLTWVPWSYWSLRINFLLRLFFLFKHYVHLFFNITQGVGFFSFFNCFIVSILTFFCLVP